MLSNNANTQPKNFEDTTSDFDPLLLDVIAQMFPISKDAEDNASIWGSYAKNATRNGLDQARATIGKGKSQSTFHPEKVGEWLISKGKGNLDQAKLYRTLGANLPARSRDKADLYK